MSEGSPRPKSDHELSQDIPGFFESQASLPTPEESSLNVGGKRLKTEPGFARQLAQAAPILALLVFVAGVLFAFWYYVIGLPDPAGTARRLVREGRTLGVIVQLEEYMGKPQVDPTLRSALGYAYVHGNAPAKALDQYEAAFAAAPGSILDVDVAALAGLLHLRGPNTQRAQALIERIGDRARPYVASTVDDEASDDYAKCRARQTLAALGAQIEAPAACEGVAAQVP